MEDRCENCRFWRDNELGEPNPQPGRVDLGECRRGHPVIVLGQTPISLQEKEFPQEARENATQAVWPVTRECDWCGEFQPKNDRLPLRVIGEIRWDEFFDGMNSTPTAKTMCRNYLEFTFIQGDKSITSVAELITQTANELLSRRQFGKNCLRIVRERLKEFGLHLRGD
jgi:hypothetical protein